MIEPNDALQLRNLPPQAFSHVAHATPHIEQAANAAPLQDSYSEVAEDCAHRFILMPRNFSSVAVHVFKPPDISAVPDHIILITSVRAISQQNHLVIDGVV